MRVAAKSGTRLPARLGIVFLALTCFGYDLCRMRRDFADLTHNAIAVAQVLVLRQCCDKRRICGVWFGNKPLCCIRYCNDF